VLMCYSCFTAITDGPTYAHWKHHHRHTCRDTKNVDSGDYIPFFSGGSAPQRRWLPSFFLRRILFIPLGSRCCDCYSLFWNVAVLFLPYMLSYIGVRKWVGNPLVGGDFVPEGGHWWRGWVAYRVRYQ
jgi:hypothetical protein